MQIQFTQIAVQKIDFSPGNPRTDAAKDVEGLAASMGRELDAFLVNPPVVKKSKWDRYLVVAGERRVRAAMHAGWTSIPCQVRDDLNAHDMHQVRVVENLHRQALNPFDQATALKISWLVANADAMGLQAQVEAILIKEQPQAHALAELEELLGHASFIPTHPAVSWNEVLNRLGVEMNAASRKKLMRVLAVDPQVQEKVRVLGLTEAALRSMGTLEVREQKLLAKELTANPDLTRKVRRIARVVRAGTHTMDEAVSEARGQVSTPQEEKQSMNETPEDEHVTDLVIRLLEAATNAQQANDGLCEMLGTEYLKKLPQVWREYAQEALAIIGKLNGIHSEK